MIQQQLLSARPAAPRRPEQLAAYDPRPAGRDTEWYKNELNFAEHEIRNFRQGIQQ